MYRVLKRSNRSHAFAKAGMHEEALQDAIKCVPRSKTRVVPAKQTSIQGSSLCHRSVQCRASDI